MLKKTFMVDNVAATRDLAHKMAQVIGANFVVALKGDLGAGKTTLIRFILQDMGVLGPIKSPTFTIVEPYTIPGIAEIYHFDLYRFNDPEEWFYAGMDEYFSAQSICFIEWMEKAVQLIPRIDWIIELIVNADNSRVINIKCQSKIGELCLNQLLKPL